MPAKRQYSMTAADSDTVPVLASYALNKKTKKPPNLHLAYLTCASCDNEVLGSNAVSPFCSCCAGNMTASSDETLEVPAKEIEKDFKTLGTCEGCNTVVAARKDILVAFDDNKIYCQVCSHPVEIKAEDDEEDSNVEDTTESDNTESTDDNMNETVNEDDTDNLFNNDENEGGGNDGTDSEANTSESTDDNTASSDEGSTGGAESDSTGGTTLNADLVKALAGKTGDIAVVASPDKTKWFLFVDNMPVASSTKDNASDNVKEMFDNDKFASSWNAATADGVTEDLLNDFGFVATKVDVPVDEAVKQNLEASIEAERAKFSITAAEMRERFDRCFGIAAVGINKDVFKKDNPVRTALIASLKNMRVRNAEHIVTAAFNEHGETYLDNISEKAAELMEKSDETLDEMAKAVDEAKYTERTEDSAVKTEKSPPLKLATFPKVEEDKVDDNQEPANGNNSQQELAASDSNGDDVIERLFAGIRRRN